MYDSDQVNDYSKKDLAEKIFNGEVSREQVNADGLFRPHRPMLDEELGLMKQEELDWTNATALNTVESYQTFLEKYNPTIVEGESITDGWSENTVYIGRHVEDARRLQAVVKKNDDATKETEKDKAAWVKAKNADTVASYTEYISTFDRQPPLYRGQYVDEAKLRVNKLQDNIDWKKAKSLDTIDSYESYLDKYGSSTSSYQGAYISDAKKAIERLTANAELDPLKNETEDWAKAVCADNIEAYKNYLAKYELVGGKYVVQAKNAIERLLEEKAWSDALGSDNVAGYNKYISLYEDKKGKHLAEAKLRLNQLEDDLAWMAATGKDDLSAYRDYLSKYDVLAPKYRGRHIEDAKNRIAHIDDKEWKKTTETNTLTVYRLYVSKFDGNHAVQKGKHLEEAKIRINRIMDDDCWANAVKQNTKDAYQDYLQKYPHGSHVSEAKKRIQPPVPPKSKALYTIMLIIITVCAFLFWQYAHTEWPFNAEVHKVDNDTVRIASPEQNLTKDEDKQNSLVEDENGRHEIVDDTKETVDSTNLTNNPSMSENNNPSKVSAPSDKKTIKTPTTIKDYEELAKSGDRSVYAILAKKYLNKNNYDKAAYWANKAWNANANRDLAKEVIDYLSDIDYYEGAKYKKPY